MPIDTSIYSNSQPVPVSLPSYSDSQEKAMRLSQMGMRRQQQQLQMQQQQALRQAYAQNTDPTTGQVNKQGVVSTLGKLGLGQMGVEQQGHFSQLDESQAKAQQAQYEASQQRDSQVAKSLHMVMTANPADQAKVYQNVRNDLVQKGVIGAQDAPETFDQKQIGQLYDHYKTATPYLKDLETQSNIAMAPAKLNSEMFGSRSPNAELSSQYGKDVAPIRGSQINMQQMMDSYSNKTPQGDASLVLQNFKIRNPNAPDVNSIEEMKSSQAVPDAWKNKLNMALKGGFDQNTRDNLMRDGISAYRANYDTYQGVKQRYQGRQQVQNVNDPSLTYEPAIEKTFKDAMALQDKVGPYVPPTERDGTLMGGLSKLASKITGGNAESTAAAAEKPKAQYRDTSSKLSGDEVAKYATKYKMKLSDAQNYLRSHGYAIGN